MKLLLDTNVLVWATKTGTLHESIMRDLRNPKNSVYYSTVSLWEIAIKNKSRRDFPWIADLPDYYHYLKNLDLSGVARQTLI